MLLPNCSLRIEATGVYYCLQSNTRHVYSGFPVMDEAKMKCMVVPLHLHSTSEEGPSPAAVAAVAAVAVVAVVVVNVCRHAAWQLRMNV